MSNKIWPTAKLKIGNSEFHYELPSMTEEDCLSLYPLADQELLDSLIKVYKDPKVLEDCICLFPYADSEAYKRTTVADAIEKGGELSIRANFNSPELSDAEFKTPEDPTKVHAILRAWTVQDGEFYKLDFVLKPIPRSCFWDFSLQEIKTFAKLYRNYVHDVYSKEEADDFIEWFLEIGQDSCMNFALKTYRTAGDRARR